MKIFFILISLLFLLNCSKKFENPIDPDVKGSIPAMPINLELIPVSAKAQVKGTFSYTYENSLGIVFQRSLKNIDTFISIDTILSDTFFKDLIDLDFDTEYDYRLFAYNENGISKYSEIASVRTSIASDIDGPIFFVKYLTDTISSKTIKVDTLTLNGSVSDPSGIASFSVTINDSLITDSLGDGNWDYTFNFIAYTNTLVFRAIDSDGNISNDTIIIYYDYQNKSPVLSTDTADGKIFVSWQNYTDIDYSYHKLWVSLKPQLNVNEATLLDSSTNSNDTIFKYSPSDISAWYYFHYIMYDSANNSNYSKIIVKYVNHSINLKLIDSGSYLSEFSITYKFYMDSIEVTQGMYDSIMKDSINGYDAYIKPEWDIRVGIGNNYAVYNVNWFDAILFCNARSKISGLDTVYTFSEITGIPGNLCVLNNVVADYNVIGFRLPTEDEWVLAARAGTTTDYYWGKDFWNDDYTIHYPNNEIDTLDFNSYAVWYGNSFNLGQGDSLFGVNEVASKLPNDNGIYDMIGNVWEWCGDWYDASRSKGRIDDAGAISGSTRVIRGGSWDTDAYFSKLSYHDFSEADKGYFNFGFRCVLVGL